MFLHEARRLGVSAGVAAPIAAGVSGSSSAVISAGVVPVFGYFLKVGALLFGSGYVLLALLRADLVVRLHWLTEAQLLDAIAVSQATPGPFFTVATFIGYVLGGTKGAALATAGMFLPAFVFVGATAKFLPKLRQSHFASAFLDGVNAAAVALMALVGWQFARAWLVSAAAVVLATASGVLVFRYRANSAWVILGGGVPGVLLRLVHPA
jgi:chromate transporter